MLIDFHSHFLPQIDDGSRSIEESVNILNTMAENGTELVAATPHFYCAKEPPDAFIARRNDAFERLKPHLKEEHPQILLGAEVLYHPSLVSFDRLPELCIQGTNWLLLEMPYTELDSKIIGGVADMADRGDLKIIVAHIERYLNFTSMKRLKELMSLDVLGQINAVSLTSRLPKRRCFKLMGMGFVHVLGSDFHRMDRGDVTVNRGYEIISASKKFSGFAEKAHDNGKKILRNEPLDSII